LVSVAVFPTVEEDIAMESMRSAAVTMHNFVGVLPETVEEAEELAASIEEAVQRETGRAVDDLMVVINPQGILLRGRCTSFYTKQLAQHAAMNVPGGNRLVNSIEVS
jgi:hypothetical protein